VEYVVMSIHPLRHFPGQPGAPGRTLVLRIGLVLLVFLAIGCEPKDVRPGAWLSGDPAGEPVDDWGFSDPIEEIFIQTRTWYGIPHSTTIWCATVDGNLYVGSYGDEKKAWEKNIARNPAARLRIDGILHDVTLTEVKDAALSAELDAAYAHKYDMAEVFGDELPPWWYYRVTLRSP